MALSAVGSVGYQVQASSSKARPSCCAPCSARGLGGIGLAGLVALRSVILAMMYGQSRIFFVMSRDDLLPHALSVVSPRTGAPVPVTALTGCLVAAVAGFFRFD